MKLVTVATQLTEEEHAALKKFAAKIGSSIKDVAREAMLAYVDNYRPRGTECSQSPTGQHVLYKCKQPCEKPGGCVFCDGGLAFCVICNKGEGELELNCPGAPDRGSL